jgi:hypothetical protein
VPDIDTTGTSGPACVVSWLTDGSVQSATVRRGNLRWWGRATLCGRVAAASRRRDLQGRRSCSRWPCSKRRAQGPLGPLSSNGSTPAAARRPNVRLRVGPIAADAAGLLKPGTDRAHAAGRDRRHRPFNTSSGAHGPDAVESPHRTPRKLRRTVNLRRPRLTSDSEPASGCRTASDLTAKTAMVPELSSPRSRCEAARRILQGRRGATAAAGRRLRA